MPKIAASLVFPISSPPRRNAVVEVDGNGTVLSLGSGTDRFREQAGVEHYSGILVPGFADVYCGQDVDGHRLLATGVRIAGRIGMPPDRDGTWEITGPQPSRASWSNRYGKSIGYRFYESEEHFGKVFSKTGTMGLYRFRMPQGELQVLSGKGFAGILDLMLALQEGPERPGLDVLLPMATINGALATGYNDVAGTIDPGKRPGLIIIEGIDFKGMRLLPGSRIRRL